ncbi:hypothetical protein EVA_14800, partial [gut metagenome]
YTGISKEISGMDNTANISFS